MSRVNLDALQQYVEHLGRTLENLQKRLPGADQYPGYP